MRRAKLIDRVKFLAEKRVHLFDAALNSQKPEQTRWQRQQAEAELEIRAIEYGIAVQRYLGGQS
jgi:hypothetical protein